MPVVGLQDGLRPGARAAVQHLLDVGIEPVLLSGDTRETCEALGRAVDIDHIRPEVLPVDRGDEIRRLADGGAVVAVLGRSPNDDATLSAVEPEADQGFDVDVQSLGAGEIAQWLAEHAQNGERSGLAFRGTWGRGTGTLSGIAIAAADEAAAWVDPTRLGAEDEAALAAWLADADQPKAVHDVKGPLLALAAHGLTLAGVTSDTALADGVLRILHGTGMNQLRAHARTTAARYAWIHVAEQYVKVYQEAITIAAPRTSS